MRRKEQSKEDFLNTRVTYGLILRADLRSLQHIKEFLANSDAKIIYQTISGGKLQIIKGDDLPPSGHSSQGSEHRE